MRQILSNEIIYEVIKSSNVLHKSMISFMFTTGLKHDKLRTFKIKDLLRACSAFMDKGESIDDLLKKNSLEIIPCWRISDSSNVGICFNTPETTQYLFDYLKDRQRYANFNEESYLFKNYNKGTPALNDEEQLEKDFITKELSRKKKDLNKLHNGDEIQFNPGNITYTFIKICNDHLKLDDSDKKELIALFQANTTKENKFYDDPNIKEYYTELVQYLTIDPIYESYHYPDGDDGGSVEDDEENNVYSDWDIKQKIGSYYMNNIKTVHKLDYNEYDRLCGIVYDLAIYDRDSKHHTFILNDESLDNYFKKAKVQVLIEDYAEEIHVLVNEGNIDVKINEIIHLMDKIGVLYLIQDHNHLIKVIKEYLTFPIHDYGEFVITSSAINDIINLCIDGFFMN